LIALYSLIASIILVEDAMESKESGKSEAGIDQRERLWLLLTGNFAEIARLVGGCHHTTQ
jgi:hypothetical protein